MLLTARAVADETASPDNWKAITESPQSQTPGFQVNPPVREDTGRQQMLRGGGPCARQPLGTRVQAEAGAGAAVLFGGKERSHPYLSMITGSEGVSFLLPQLFLSQHRLRSNGEQGF